MINYTIKTNIIHQTSILYHKYKEKYNVDINDDVSLVFFLNYIIISFIENYNNIDNFKFIIDKYIKIIQLEQITSVNKENIDNFIDLCINIIEDNIKNNNIINVDIDIDIKNIQKIKAKIYILYYTNIIDKLIDLGYYNTKSMENSIPTFKEDITSKILDLTKEFNKIHHYLNPNINLSINDISMLIKYTDEIISDLDVITNNYKNINNKYI